MCGLEDYENYQDYTFVCQVGEYEGLVGRLKVLVPTPNEHGEMMLGIV